GLAGVAVGSWLGLVDPTVPLIAVSVAVAAAVFWLKEKTELVTDTIMALLLSGSVAFGIIVFSLLQRRPGDIQGFRFGDMLAVGPREVGEAGLLFVVVGVGVFAHLSELSLITAQEEMAYVGGVQ